MATVYQNLSQYDFDKVPDASRMKIGIVVSEWNPEVTEELLKGACNTLERHGVQAEGIIVHRVPGSFELTYGASQMVKNLGVDAVIALGCVVQGDTPHFDYVCSGVTQGVTQLNVHYDIPVIFGILTTSNMQQAFDRAGGKHGNKGDEAAITAIKMIDYACKLKKK